MAEVTREEFLRFKRRTEKRIRELEEALKRAGGEKE